MPSAPVPDAALQEIRAQLLQLQQAQAKQQALLLQERTERQTARSLAEQTIADQLERVRQAKEYVESLVCSFPSILEAQAQEQAQAIVRKLQPQVSRVDIEKLVAEAQQAAASALEQRFRDAQQAAETVLEQRVHESQQATEAALEKLVRDGQQATLAALAKVARDAQQTTEASLELRVHNAQQATEAALQQFVRGSQQAVEAALEKRIGDGQRATEAALEQRVRDAQRATETALEQLVRDAQRASETALEQRAARLKDDLYRHLEQMVEGRRAGADAACAAATQQLQALEERANHVTALVDVELQKHAEEIVAETVTEIRSQLQQASEALPALEDLVRRSTDAISDLRATMKSVQQEHRMNEAATARLQHRSEAVQAWLASETEKFQQSVREAFLDAGGEIRGRIAQAVETASEPIESCSRDLQQRMSALTQEHVQELQRHADTVCDRLRASSQDSQAEIAAALQARISEALEHFSRDAQQLAQGSIERWQSAVTKTLAAIPKLLSDHFAGEQ